ncbi:MAG TPA: cellulase family glycosylhydrolase [Propionicimonas sp.]
MSKDESFLGPGTLMTGCNYWASHAGTAMWQDWRPEVVAADLRQLAAEAGLRVIRVFPLWSDFQPIRAVRGAMGQPVEMRLGEEPLPATPLGVAGISQEMADRFEALLDLADDRGLRVIVSLLTGWMSGRLFAPTGLDGRNLVTDPVALTWEIRFVKAFVRHFAGHPAIAAWELGNECNCLAPADRDEAFTWTATIADAVRSVDPSRPVASGMHSLAVAADKASWTIQDQAESCDLLTTHPYPLFTPYCALDPIDEIRNGLHATAESRLYGDVGGRPCFVEEAGTLGPSVSSEQVAADYAWMSLVSAAAHNCRGYLWWCAYDQDHLTQAPYDSTDLERELGLFRSDRSAKPIVASFRRFADLLGAVPDLPAPVTDAVCVLGDGPADQWGIALASFVLAKQAGFDLRFRRRGQDLPASGLYLLPSISGHGALRRGEMDDLLRRVEDGAVLYVSADDLVVTGLAARTGMEVVHRSSRSGPARFTTAFTADAELTCDAATRYELAVTGAEVLGRELDGNPCLSVVPYGAGRVYMSSLPLEASCVARPGAFHEEAAPPFWRIYAAIAANAIHGRALRKVDPRLGVTEHHLARDERLAVLINYSPRGGAFTLGATGGWSLDAVPWGAVREAPDGTLVTELTGNDVAVVRLRRRP